MFLFHGHPHTPVIQQKSPSAPPAITGGRPLEPGATEVRDACRRLLDLYASDDQTGVLSLVDQSRFVLFGSDLSERIATPEDLRRFMADDFKLWGSAEFGQMGEVDIRISGDLATAFFHAPFTVKGQPSVVVRFCTVWSRISGQWKLTQCANTVPTVKSSAREILSRLGR